MSILLNAINKSKQDQDDALLESDNVTPEIEDLLDSPLDEYPAEDNSKTSTLGQAKTFQMITLLLGIIAVLLLGIVTLMLMQQLSSDDERMEITSDQAVNSEVTVASTKPDSSESQNSRRIADTSLLESNRSQKGDIELDRGLDSGSENNSEQTVTSENQPYFESYQTPKKVIKPKVTRTPKKVVNEAKKSAANNSLSGSPAASKPVSDSSSSFAQVSTNIPKTMDQLSPADLLSAQQVGVDAHVFSKDASKSFIFVNGKLKQTGDNLVDGWVLERIDEDSIVIKKGSLLVRKEIPK